MYQDLANFTEEQIATFEEAGNYITEIIPGLKIMSYNTNYGCVTWRSKGNVKLL